MKLNNRGWGLQAMMIGVLVLMIALIITAVLINKVFGDIIEPINKPNYIENSDAKEESTYKTYQEMENEIITAAKKYQKKYYSDILDGEKITVTVKNLQAEYFIDELTDIKNEKTICTGYATFLNDDDKISYKAYIKCGNSYETIGYQSYYDSGE